LTSYAISITAGSDKLLAEVDEPASEPEDGDGPDDVDRVLGSPRGSCEDLRGSTDAVDGEGETLCPQSVDQYVTHRGRGGKHARSVG
ncbi:hypothetical protein, partial [Streptobacillus moniliformis]|uniref:hypothetical protein n=1 Tax=Streptobacillus moniliformis TaxID=34105 RepID=UPI000A8C3154